MEKFNFFTISLNKFLHAGFIFCIECCVHCMIHTTHFCITNMTVSCDVCVCVCVSVCMLRNVGDVYACIDEYCVCANTAVDLSSLEEAEGWVVQERRARNGKPGVLIV